MSTIRTLTILALVTSACTQSRTQLQELTETTIGAAGGSATSAAGELSLVFAAGTLPDGTVVRIQTDRSSSDPALLTPIYAISVEGDAVRSFDPPAQLTLSAAQPGRLVEVGVSSSGLSSSYDSAEHKIRGPISKPGRYSAQALGGCPADVETATSCNQPGLECPMGQICCCGACAAERIYFCDGGRWNQFYTDYCLSPDCTDGGPGDAYPGADVVLDPDSGPSCTGTDYCIECGSDLGLQAVCDNGQWTCPNGGGLLSQYDVNCRGRPGGPCGDNNACQSSVCGANGRCGFDCHAPDAVGRCRVATATAGCCLPDPVDGLCGIPPILFSVCPLGAVEVTTCTSTAPGC